MVILFKTILFAIIGFLVVALIVPGMSFMDAAEIVFSPIYIDVPAWFFHTFMGYFDALQSVDNSANNPVQDFLGLLMLLGSIACALALPVLWCVSITFAFWLAIYSVAPKVANGILTVFGGYDSSPEMENWKHIINGRTTIQDTYDADVQANAIANALKNNK